MVYVSSCEVYLVIIPSIFLRRLYVKKSLKNTEEGFELMLRNVLADAVLIKPLEIHVDSKPIPIGSIKLITESGSVLNKDVSESNPVNFSLNTAVTIRVEGIKLEPGEHEIVFVATTKDYGSIKFNVRDSIGFATVLVC